MKNRKLLLIVSLVLALTMSLGGTLAYLTDTDADINVMTVGRVSITQNEQDSEGKPFEQNQQLLPIVGSTTEKDANGYTTAANYIDKIVTVTNTGNTDAWVRTLIAVPVLSYTENSDITNASNNVLHWNGYGEGHEEIRQAAGQLPGTLEKVANHWWWGKQSKIAWPGNTADWNSYTITLDDLTYDVYVVTHTTKVGAGETTAPNMIGLYLDERVDYDNDTGNYTLDGCVVNGMSEDLEILVLSQAVQAGGFDTAWQAFDAAFPLTSEGKDEKVTLEGWFSGWTEKDIGTPGDKWPNNEPPVIADVKVNNTADLNEALAAGYSNIELSAGNYTFPATAAFAGDETIICEEGVVFTGTSKLNIGGATVIGATFDNPAGTAADQTINGTFKNCTFTGTNGLRWCYAGETVVFEDCVFSGSTYGAHFDSGANEVLFKNCSFSGFNAMGSAITKLTLDGCTFVANGKSNYNGINLWGSTDLIDCTFVFDGTAENEWVEACAGGGATYNITNCVVSNGLTEKALDATVFTTRSEDNIINFN